MARKKPRAQLTLFAAPEPAAPPVAPEPPRERYRGRPWGGTLTDRQAEKLAQERWGQRALLLRGWGTCDAVEWRQEPGRNAYPVTLGSGQTWEQMFSDADAREARAREREAKAQRREARLQYEQQE